MSAVFGLVLHDEAQADDWRASLSWVSQHLMQAFLFHHPVLLNQDTKALHIQLALTRVSHSEILAAFCLRPVRIIKQSGLFTAPLHAPLQTLSVMLLCMRSSSSGAVGLTSPHTDSALRIPHDIFMRAIWQHLTTAHHAPCKNCVFCLC